TCPTTASAGTAGQGSSTVWLGRSQQNGPPRRPWVAPVPLGKRPPPAAGAETHPGRRPAQEVEGQPLGPRGAGTVARAEAAGAAGQGRLGARDGVDADPDYGAVAVEAAADQDARADLAEAAQAEADRLAVRPEDVVAEVVNAVVRLVAARTPLEHDS